MKQKVSTIFVFGCFSFFSIAQQNTLPAGGEATGAGGSVSYSVGQIDYTSISASAGNVNQGVQQPYEIFAVSGIEEKANLISAVFPNPTSGLLTIELSEVSDNLSIQLTDLTGRILFNQRLQSLQTVLDVSSYATGEYLLIVTSNDTSLNTLKIIKH